VFHKTIYPLR